MTPTRPTPTPVSADTPLTLLGYRVSLWINALGIVTLAVLWVVERSTGVIDAYDTYGYPALALWFAVLMVALRHRPQHLVRTQALATLGVAGFFLGSTLYTLFSPGVPLTGYWAATVLVWLPLVYLGLFASWPLWQALGLSLLMLVGTTVPTVIIGVTGHGGPDWQPVIWPLLFNSLLAHALFLLALMGVGRLKRMVATLTASAGAADAESALHQWNAQRVEELARARDAAEAASQAKTRFLAVMSHELRTPLNAVLGAAELLREPSTEPIRHAELINTIRRSGGHLLQLIDQVLELSRIESGQLDLAHRAFDISACIEDAVAALISPARGKGLLLSAEIGPGVSVWRMGDGVRLRQILLNLLDNAVKFTDIGRVALTLNDLSGKSGWLRLTISDTGPGIAREQQQRVFDPFAQGDDASTRRHAGVGLGLTITHELVQRMGGQLQMNSAPGQGTEIEIELPLPCADDDRPSAPSSLDEGIALDGMQVLIVEDDPVNQTLAAEMLRGVGAQVSVAENGVQALEVLRGAIFDVVLMDWRMPEMDGLEATRRVRAGEAGPNAARLPILALTANAFREDRHACLEAGMDDVLTKPIERLRLLKAVRRWHGRRHALH